MTLFKTYVDLAESARRSLAALEMKMGGFKAWEVSVRTEPAWVDADPTRLEQMISNLLENAFKYTPEGGSIDMRVTPEGSTALLKVRDTGIGIDPAHLSEIFEMFTQAPRRSPGQGGLGIGLAVVRQLAQQHGADLSVESEGEGKGSTFCLRFPLIALPNSPSGGLPADDVDAVPAVRFPAAANTAQADKPILVLIDDNDDLRTMVAQLLAGRGMQVKEAANGMDGLQAIETWRPAVALVDIDLPDISGHEVAARVRTAGWQTKLIALTGFGQDSDRRKAMDAGFDAHLKKPLDIDELTRLLAG